MPKLYMLGLIPQKASLYEECKYQFKLPPQLERKSILDLLFRLFQK